MSMSTGGGESLTKEGGSGGHCMATRSQRWAASAPGVLQPSQRKLKQCGNENLYATQPLLSKDIVARPDDDVILLGMHRVGSSLPYTTMVWETCRKRSRRQSSRPSSSCEAAARDICSQDASACSVARSNATPSAPHKRSKMNKEFRVEDYVHVEHHPNSVRPLTARQRGALFAQFSLPISNLDVLPHLMPMKWHSESAPVTTEIQALNSAGALEELIPSC
jgi:hypothetical protein